MYEKTRLDKLESMARYAEEAPHDSFTMRHWWCGSTGCLVGHYWANSNDPMLRDEYGDDLSVSNVDECFGLSKTICCFLFWSHDGDHCVDASFLDQHSAIARLRKTIRYLRRKQDLWRDHEDLMAMSRRDRRERLLAPIPA